MDKHEYKALEAHMLACMEKSGQDNVHDDGHVYRVVYTALRLLRSQPKADAEVVLAAALLHDIGRKNEENAAGNGHAEVGAGMAHAFLLARGWPPEKAAHVRACIATHSRGGGKTPQSLEAKIVYDADKLDLTGAVGVARSMLWGAQIGEPLYRLGEDGLPTPGKKAEAPSLLREYRQRLRGLSDDFYTRKAREIALKRQKSMDAYFAALRKEVGGAYRRGPRLLAEFLD